MIEKFRFFSIFHISTQFPRTIGLFTLAPPRLVEKHLTDWHFIDIHNGETCGQNDLTLCRQNAVGQVSIGQRYVDQVPVEQMFFGETTRHVYFARVSFVFSHIQTFRSVTAKIS
jgi:hypothetical protein